MKIKILLSIIAAVILFSCNNSKCNQVAKAVDVFYKNYKGHFEDVDKSLLSVELASLIDRATALEDRSEAELKAAKSTDKPARIEGDIFTSMYGGYTSYKIRRVKTDEDKAKVRVEFTNSREGNRTWTDEVDLIKERGFWKIDNVLYRMKNAPRDNLKLSLSGFLVQESIAQSK